MWRGCSVCNKKQNKTQKTGRRLDGVIKHQLRMNAAYAE